MKKTTITLFMAGLLAISGIKAQSVQEGVANVTADRFKTAISIFDKLLAANPNNWEAVYWKGQAYLDDDKNDDARQLYANAMQASNNAPIILVGVGHVELLDKKTAEARQHFETALTMTRDKKGDNPQILYAIGRANVDAKEGDYNYAIEKLEQAVQKEPNNAEYYLQLGNAYRKARPGEGGGKAYENYNKALQVNPAYANAAVRLAKLFETQKNWELVVQHLNDAVKRDPKFTPAYYELFYFYFQHELNFPEAEGLLKKYIDSKLPESDIQDQFLYAQLNWAGKDFDAAITKAENVVSAMGDRTKPKVYKLLADAYFRKGNYTSAKNYIDKYMAKEKPEGKIAFDYKLKADIMYGLGSPCEELFSVYIEGAPYDTVLASRIDYLQIAADSFKARNCKRQFADMSAYIFTLKGRQTAPGLVNLGIAYTQVGDDASLLKADSLFAVATTNFPDSIYGHYWRGKTNYTIDTSMTKEPFASNMVNGYQRALEIAPRDIGRFKSMGVNSALVLAGYYNNVKSDKTTALTFINKGLEIDSSNAQLKSIQAILSRPSNTKQPNPRGNSTPAKTKTTGTTTTTTKNSAVKPKTTTSATKTAVKK